MDADQTISIPSEPVTKKTLPIFIILVYSIVIFLPVLIYGFYQFYDSPDVFYILAKTVSVLNGDIFGDPISGFPTFHPPFYHLFLAGGELIGINIDNMLMIVTWFNIFATALFFYLALRQLFDRKVSLATSLFIPFIIEYLGPGNILLASSFYFSLPFYLAGLWIYLKSDRGIGLSALIGLLWGLAFLISPVFVFLIGFSYLFDLLFISPRRPTVISLVVFIITLIPFFYQGHLIYESGMYGTSAFSLWRGFPTLEWIRANLVLFPFPATIKMQWWQLVLGVSIYLWIIISLWKFRPINKLIIIGLVAYIFTSYHFNFNYAVRLKLIFLGLASAYAFQYLYQFKLSIWIRHAIAAALILIAIGDNLNNSLTWFENEKDSWASYNDVRRDAQLNLGQFLKNDRYILATEKTYRFYIMPNFNVHALLAYSSGEYYQLNSNLSHEMQRDYEALTSNPTPRIIEIISGKYNMDTAVFGRWEIGTPLFNQISSTWENLYAGKQFLVFKKHANT